MTTRLTNRERATVLAALRCWQQARSAHEPQTVHSPDHFDDALTPLTPAEVDDLCERLNRAPLPGETARQLFSLAAPIQVWLPQANHPSAAIALLGKRFQSGDFVEVTVHGLIPASGGFQALDQPITLMLSRALVAAVQDVDLTPPGDARGHSVSSL